jgi:hypothetical protein
VNESSSPQFTCWPQLFIYVPSEMSFLFDYKVSSYVICKYTVEARTYARKEPTIAKQNQNVFVHVCPCRSDFFRLRTKSQHVWSLLPRERRSHLQRLCFWGLLQLVECSALRQLVVGTAGVVKLWLSAGLAAYPGMGIATVNLHA